MNKDCVFFQESYEDLPSYHACKRSGSLYLSGKEDDIMCSNCRLWDAYIPETATEQAKVKALRWQDAKLNEQEDYEEYFKL